MNHRKIEYNMILTLSTLIVVAIGGLSQAGEIGRSSITQHIEKILSNPHGLYRLSVQDYEAIEEMRRGLGQEHLAILNEAIHIYDGKAIHDTANVQRRNRALGLLGLIGGDLARSALIEDYQRITTRVRALERPDSDRKRGGAHSEGTIATLRHLRLFTLKQLTKLGAGELLDEVMKEIQVAVGATRVVMLSYLEKVAPLRPDIRPELVDMYNSPDSPLRNHPQLLRVLEAMDDTESKRDAKPNNRAKESQEKKDG